MPIRILIHTRIARATAKTASRFGRYIAETASDNIFDYNDIIVLSVLSIVVIGCIVCVFIKSNKSKMDTTDFLKEMQKTDKQKYIGPSDSDN